MGDVVNAEPHIEGLSLTPLRVIADSRGAVLHLWRGDNADSGAIGECYFSEVLPGSVKAWKRHRRQTQNLAVPSGRARFVIVDCRETSSTRGSVRLIELGRPDAYSRLRIPPLVWYGFTALGESPCLIANCPDIPHDPAEGETIALEEIRPEFALRALQEGVVRA